MSASFRRLFACLLLVLLPLQAIAAGYVAARAPVVPCAMAMAGHTDCCDDEAGCAPADCIAIVMAALPVAPALLPDSAATCAVSDDITLLQESYCPEGPQRPPQALS